MEYKEIMFVVPDFETILKGFETRQNIIKKLDNIPVTDLDYLTFLRSYKTVGVNSDMEVFDYDSSLRENKYIEENHPAISKKAWMTGRTGQGDEWFIEIGKNNHVLFYDHNKGEYLKEGFIDLEIGFSGFLKMGKVIHELDTYMDNDTQVEEPKLINALNSISPCLYEKYPFRYW